MINFIDAADRGGGGGVHVVQRLETDLAETDSPDDGAARLSLKNRTHGLRPDL